ncbi:MAG: hypothetical protein ABI772_12425, partial [Bacteroidota bacterium]
MKTTRKIILSFLFLGITFLKSQAQTVHTFSNLDELLDLVGYVCYDPTHPTEAPNVIVWPSAVIPHSPAVPGDIIRAASGTVINLDELATFATGCNGIPRLPLLIPSGVTLEGDYDLLGDDFTNPNDPLTVITGKPDGTLFYSSTYRSQYDGDNSPSNTDCRSLMYFFAMQEGSTTPGGTYRTSISHVRIQGPSQNWTEFNIGSGTGSNQLLCGGIQIWRACKFDNPITTCQTHYGYGYQISNCEISGFSLAAIFTENGTDDILI